MEDFPNIHLKPQNTALKLTYSVKVISILTILAHLVTADDSDSATNVGSICVINVCIIIIIIIVIILHLKRGRLSPYTLETSVH